MLSAEDFFYRQKGKVYYSTQLTMKCPHLSSIVGTFYNVSA